MQTIHAINECDLQETFRTKQVQGMFDLPASAHSRTEFNVELPNINDDWSIGLIVGPSGSGKTTIAQQAFPQHLIDKWNWPTHQSILDGFPQSLGISEITHLLSSVGFSSPPSWMRPFNALSNGEQFRVNLARTLAQMPDLAVVDEFTSVVDRTVAQIGSAALAKTVRRRHQKFVAVTCHYDVKPWLQPDWILDMADASFTRSGPLNPTDARLLQRPPISLEIRRCRPSAWKLFKRHHYLSSEIHPAAQCFMATISNEPAAFVAALSFPHPIRPGWREHRCVCLPDFQGVGIGHATAEFVASLFRATNKPYTSCTSHPAMIRHRAASPLWRMIRAPSRNKSRRRNPNDLQAQFAKTLSWRRMTASFEFIGSSNPDLADRFGIRNVKHNARNYTQ
jgi:hypothetical protein